MTRSSYTPIQAFVAPALAACAAQFPRRCSNCNRDFTSFGDFITSARQIGTPMLDPIEDEAPLGLLVFFNCNCGTTIGICCEDVSQHARFNSAALHLAASGEPLPGVLQAFVDQLKALARDASPRPASGTQTSPDALMLEVGAAMIALIEAGRVPVPPRPSAALTVVELARSPDSSVALIVAALEADPALPASVLLRANSAMYGLGRAITTLPAAVARIGMQEVGRLALTASLGASATSEGPLRPVRAALWHRTLLRAFTCRHLATGRGGSGDEAFVAGLLHGFGTLIGVLALEKVVRSRPVPFPVQPLAWWLRVLEHFRADLGALTAREWKLVAALKEVIALHPGVDRTKSAHSALLDVVDAANVVARTVENEHLLSAAQLGIAGLRSGEASSLASAIPTWAPALAVMQSSVTALPKGSLVTAAAVDATALEAPFKLRHLATDAVCDVVAVSGSLAVLESSTPLPLEALTAFAPVDSPSIVVWGTAGTDAQQTQKNRAELHLFPQTSATATYWARQTMAVSSAAIGG